MGKSSPLSLFLSHFVLLHCRYKIHKVLVANLAPFPSSSRRNSSRAARARVRFQILSLTSARRHAERAVTPADCQAFDCFDEPRRNRLVIPIKPHTLMHSQTPSRSRTYVLVAARDLNIEVPPQGVGIIGSCFLAKLRGSASRVPFRCRLARVRSIQELNVLMAKRGGV
jgi:hypothetical protein